MSNTVPDSSSAVSSEDAEIAAFAGEFRSWLADNLPTEWQAAPFPRMWPPGSEDDPDTSRSRAWHRLLFDGGWIAPGWPVERGGRALDMRRRMVMVDEHARAGSPVPIGFQGIDILGPALIEFGSEYQRDRFLKPILTADDIWCQGYSEPDSGSDLASMATTAVRDGDTYIVNGQKVWTSFGRRASWCFLLARTGDAGSRSRGISFLLTPMDAPGVEWRPIRQITGETDFGELFLSDVRIPVEHRVGDEGEGWQVAMHSLAFERLLASSVAPLQRRVTKLIELVRDTSCTPELRTRVINVVVRLHALSGLQASTLEMARTGDRRFSVWSSMIKLGTSELRQEVASVATSLLGAQATASGPGANGPSPFDGDVAARWAYEVLDATATTIYAGTSEIQRNIVAEQGLGLPR